MGIRSNSLRKSNFRENEGGKEWRPQRIGSRPGSKVCIPMVWGDHVCLQSSISASALRPIDSTWTFERRGSINGKMMCKFILDLSKISKIQMQSAHVSSDWTFMALNYGCEFFDSILLGRFVCREPDGGKEISLAKWEKGFASERTGG
jgi:hypothetical protein